VVSRRGRRPLSGSCPGGGGGVLRPAPRRPEPARRRRAGQPSRQPGGTGVPAGTRTATADDVSTPPLLEVPDSHTTTRSEDPVRVVPLPPRAELPEPDRGTAQAARPVLNRTAPRASATGAGKNTDVRTMTRPLCPFLPRNDDDRPPFGMGPVSPGSPSAFSDQLPADGSAPPREVAQLSCFPPRSVVWRGP
jgi:hypothetical protein